MGVAEFLIWMWMILFLHAFAWAQLLAGRADMIVVGSTTVPDDDCSRTCLRRLMEEGKRPGVNIKKCRKECKEAEGDGAIFVGSTQFPYDEDTAKCIDQLANRRSDKSGAFVRDCRNRRKITRQDVANEDLSSFINDTFIDLSQSSDEIITVQNGSSVLLKCTVVNRNDYPVYWVRRYQKGDSVVIRNIVGNGELLLRNNHYQIEGDHHNKSFHLRITRVRPNHAGTYICQVYTSDIDNTVEQIEVKLIVNVAASIQGFTPLGADLPKVYNGPIKKFVYNESDDVALRCDPMGSPTPNVTWRKENDRLTPGEQPSVNNELLQIANIQRSHGGIYSCTANNYGPLEAAVKKIQIIVQYAPTLTVKKAEIREPEGEYVTLECYVDAMPRAEYVWIKDNTTINADDAGIDDRPKSTKLIIVSLNAATDYGEYTCHAANLLGKASGIIEVSGRPRKPTILSDPTGTRKHSFKLVWTHGDKGKPDNPRRIEVDSYVIEYYGWWIQQRGQTQQLVFSQPANDPNREMVIVQPAQYRMTYVLRDLKENVTYNVSIYGRNKYGNGARSTLEFCTASVPKRVSHNSSSMYEKCTPGVPIVVVIADTTNTTSNITSDDYSIGYEDYIATTMDTTTYDTGLRSDEIDGAAKYWQPSKKGNSAIRHVPCLLHVIGVVLFYKILCL